MVLFTLKTAGFALLSFGLAARQAMAVDTCLGLITEIGASSAAMTITLEDDFACDTHIEIGASQTVTIEGDFTITIGTLFAGSTELEGSLFVNEGTLTLNGVTFATLAADGNRAVWNTGTLSVIGCTFNLFADGGMLTRGGVIYSDSSDTIIIIDSLFQSNVVTERGAAVCAVGSETLSITSSTFRNNEVGTGVDATGAGGDIFADVSVELTVTGTVFSGSTAEYGGAAIECCGAEITNSTFSGTDSSSDLEHFGALLVGRRDAAACPRILTLKDCKFTGCTVGSDVGAGGALAIFDTTATIEDCTFEDSVGTAVLFESSSAIGEHELDMVTVQFNQNIEPAETFATGTSQGAAVVVVNTGVADGGDPVEMGDFFNIFCFANDPYECEFVYDGAEIRHEGEFKCDICDIDGVPQASGTDDDFVVASDRDIDSSSESWESKDYIIAGLSGMSGLLLILAIGFVVVRKCKNGTHSGETQAPPAPAPPSLPAPTGPSAPTGVHATTGTMEPAVQA